MKNRHLATLAIAVALAGCDQMGNIGVGSTTSQSQSQSTSQDLSENMNLGDRQDKTEAVSINFPNLALSALLGGGENYVSSFGTLIITFNKILTEQDVPGSLPPSPTPQFNPQILLEAASDVGWPMDLSYQKMANGKWEEGVELYKKAHMLALIAAATKPGAGWPVKVMGMNTPIGDAEPDAYHHAENISVAACFTSHTLANIHQNLPKGVLFKSPEEMLNQVRNTYLGLPISKLESDLKTCREYLHKASITLNLSGTPGQEWRIGDLYITRDSRGTTFTKNGAKWFGDGLTEGKLLEVKASHAITSEMLIAAANTLTSDYKGSQEIGGKVGVGK